MRLTLAIALCLAASPAMAQNPDFTLSKGSLTKDGKTTTQTVSIVNNTQRTFELIKVECGFFDGDQLLVSDNGLAEKVAPGQRAFVEVLNLKGATTATRTECRVVPL